MEILNKMEIMEISCNWWIAVVAILIGTGLAIWLREALLVFLVTIVGLIIMLCASTEIPTGRYQYEAIITDDSGYKEMVENYNIVEVKGQIYVIEEKGVEEDG